MLCHIKALPFVLQNSDLGRLICKMCSRFSFDVSDTRAVLFLSIKDLEKNKFYSSS